MITNHISNKKFVCSIGTHVCNIGICIRNIEDSYL